MPLNANDVTTPELFADMCEEVKAGILEVLNETLIPFGPPAPGEKLPKIKNRRIIDRNADAWAKKLRSNRHREGDPPNHVEKVHTFMVGYGGLATYEGQSVGQKGFVLRFLIDSYYEDETGSDSDNPEKRHAREVAKAAYALFQSRVLKRPGLVKKIADFSERRGFTKMGETVVRESLGEVFVELQSVPLPRPA